MERIDFNIHGVEFSIFKDDLVWGDGRHETTQFMMELIYKHGVKDKSVIDIGTGTGILSVLCGKLGAFEILALDSDTHSCEWARKNFKRNKVEAEVEVGDLTRYVNDKADVVIANLPGPMQLENMNIVNHNLNDEGILIISWEKVWKFEDYVTAFEVIDHIEGTDYDGYVLKRK